MNEYYDLKDLQDKEQTISFDINGFLTIDYCFVVKNFDVAILNEETEQWTDIKSITWKQFLFDKYAEKLITDEMYRRGYLIEVA